MNLHKVFRKTWSQKNKSILVLASVLMGLTLSSCSLVSDWSTGDLTYGKKAGKPILSAKQNVDFKTISSFVFNDCLKCHSGTRDPQLTSLSVIRLKSAEIWESVRSNAMPPQRSGYSPLDECQKALLKNWLDQGAPESSTVTVADLGSVCVQNPPEDQKPPEQEKPILDMPLNYATLYKEIIQPKCMHCHDPNGGDWEAALYPLHPFEAFKNEKRMLSQDIKESKFYKAVTAPDSDRMPPADDSPRLEPEEVEFIKRWLEKGFPEN
jgi:uncharacterized membrane protein